MSDDFNKSRTLGSTRHPFHLPPLLSSLVNIAQPLGLIIIQQSKIAGAGEGSIVKCWMAIV